MTTLLKIQNLKCHGCANTIIIQLSKLSGISQVEVMHATDEVHFSYQSDNDLKTAIQKLSSLGYPILGDANSFGKKAKSFVSCAVGRMSK